MKRKSNVKRKPKRAPKIKKVKLAEADVLYVEMPPKTIPAILHPEPHVMKIAPLPPELPPEKVKGFWARFWSGE